MNSDLESVLTLQEDDRRIRELERRIAAVAPRLREFERARESAAQAIARSRELVEQEERRRRELDSRIAAHRQLHDRNASQLESVRNVREATAGMAQMDRARRILEDEEMEMRASEERLAALREEHRGHEAARDALDAEESAIRATLDAETVQLREELEASRSARDGSAARVPRSLLARYDRIRVRRQSDAVYPLRSGSCGSCDTAIPLQRRNEMLRTGAIEICEACGVLLFARPESL